MQTHLHNLQSWWRGLRWSGLSPAARREIAFWAVVSGALFFIFHLHGNSQEIATARHSLFRWLNTRWTGDYAYGMFLPFASLLAIFWKRRELANAPRRVDWRGAPLLVVALTLHWLGVLAQQPRISATGFILLLWALPFFLYGWAFARWLLFPVSYLFLAIPLNFIADMTAPLRLFATAVSAWVLNGFGLQVIREGAGLYSAAANSFSFNVAPECSGLRSLLAMTALMAFYAWYSQKSQWKKWFFFLMSIPVAIIANICRIILVVMVAAFFGQEKAMDLWHDYSGYPIFLIGIALMLLLDRLLNTNYKNLWNKLKYRFLAPASS